jgi:carotenoid 1,2-hydratase
VFTSAPLPGTHPTPRPSAAAAAGPSFDVPVPLDGYRWWYVDGLSDDGTHGLTVIAFVGSVFSPYYVRARRRGPADPLDHCALNVALYGAGGGRWAMTERRRAHVARSPERFAVGPSSVAWDGAALTIEIDEWTVPIPSRLRGRVRLWPEGLQSTTYPLDAAGAHRWTPYAPRARLEVEFDRPALRWSGTGYFDSNAGDEPVERGFARWTWSRADLNDGAAVLYDTERVDGSRSSLALQFDRTGRATPFDPPPPAPLATTSLWRVPRATRGDRGSEGARVEPPRVVATFEDTPFYSRSLVESQLLGSRVRSVHESLDLRRFASPVVQWMLPFRMPRVLR